MSAGQEKISCSIYQKHEPRIESATDRINRARDPREKIRHAEKLLEEVKGLLDCSEYKEKDPVCSSCRTIANLRKQTAELIVRAKKLI